MSQPPFDLDEARPPNTQWMDEAATRLRSISGRLEADGRLAASFEPETIAGRLAVIAECMRAPEDDLRPATPPLPPVPIRCKLPHRAVEMWKSA